MGSAYLRTLSKGSHPPGLQGNERALRDSCPAPCGVELLPHIPLLTQGRCARLALPAHCLCSGRAAFTFSVSTGQMVFHVSQFKDSLKLVYVEIINDGLKENKIIFF